MLAKRIASKICLDRSHGMNSESVQVEAPSSSQLVPLQGPAEGCEGPLLTRQGSSPGNAPRLTLIT